MIKLLALRFLRWFCHPEYLDEIEGDLEELYQRQRPGNRRQWRFLWQVITLLRPGLLRSLFHFPVIQPAMFLHDYQISRRTLIRKKLYTLINITGLSVGMGVCLLIFQYIDFEFSYDSFHQNKDNIYRLTQENFTTEGSLGTSVFTYAAIGEEGVNHIPGVLQSARIRPEEMGLIVSNPANEVKFKEKSIWYTDSDLLQIFDFPLKYGSGTSVMDDPHNMIITEEIATRYFGSDDPVGQTLKVSGGALTGEFVITGVLASLPANSHLRFDILLPLDFLLGVYGPYKNLDNGWEWDDFVTYISLDPASDPMQVGDQFNELLQDHAGEALAQNGESRKIGLQPLADIHLKSNVSRDFQHQPGNLFHVQFFGLVAVFILLIAWINYVNLATAHAMSRAKEVGVRKSVGAYRSQVIGRFLTESFLLNGISAIVAIGLAYFLLPFLNQLTGKELNLQILGQPVFWMIAIAIIVMGTVLSGFYPAWALSTLKPVSVLKSSFSMFKKGIGLRRSLIVFQFLSSVLLISGAYLVYQQISYMKNQDLGMDIEKVLVVNGPLAVLENHRSEMVSLFQRFKDQVQQDASLLSVTATSQIPGEGYMGTRMVRKPGAPATEVKEAYVIFIDTTFANTYGLDFLAKRPWPATMASYQWVVLNENALDAFKLGTPEQALNQRLVVFGDTVRIAGVVKSPHWNSLKDANVPILFTLDPYYGVFFSVEMNMNHVEESIAHIESSFHAIYPDDPFHYFFLDDDFNQQYQADLQFGHLFTAFSMLAITIACIGLFALVSFSMNLKVKEIGIRKVLGAESGQLMILLSREYLLLILIAIVLAIPVIVVGGKIWLNNYAYRVEVGVEHLVIPATLLLVIALLTVSFQTLKAATANPVDNLKSE